MKTFAVRWAAIMGMVFGAWFAQIPSAFADTGTATSIEARYDSQIGALTTSGTYSWDACSGKKRVGFALFIDEATPEKPENGSLDKKVHLASETSCEPKGTWTDAHTLSALPAKVCVVIYDVQEDSIGKTGNHSDISAGTERNTDNSFDKNNSAYGEGACAIPEIVNPPIKEGTEAPGEPAPSSSGEAPTSEQPLPEVKKDEDRDRIDDTWETSYGLDAGNANDAGQDSDGDGLSNAIEFQISSNPLKPDTDDDGMPDQWEHENRLHITQNDAAADPDDDGFTNLEEYKNETDPNQFDARPCSIPGSWLFWILLLFIAGFGMGYGFARMKTQPRKA